MQKDQIAVIDSGTLTWLAAVCEEARRQGQTVSITVDGGLKVKRGESMWTPPLGKTLAQIEHPRQQ